MASMALRRGLSNYADTWNQAVVEATLNAVEAYEKCGFRVTIERMKFVIDEKFADRRKPVLQFMTKRVGVNGRD